ncbi:hypothetical protein [Pseudoxanthomonas winnipegensis]|uniref:hypothetical protein n=1 Tax=Pseudoxanthomonas winnipegensis TaxID=2480810 RepID=UPI00103CCE01|nr:hypothetical protein [Pseudoxanthomonas winnipegensis]TBV69166.1 hypothetical protein EYC45_19805 [Pseudoxanthomonas winnipegensis]
MKKLIATLITAAMLVGCASMPQGQVTDKKAVTKSALKGGGIGCAVGAVTGLVFGKKDDALKGCAAGAVVGGVSAAVAERNRQIEEANALAAAAQAAGMAAKVETVKDVAAGDTQASERVKSATIDLPEDVTGKDVTDVVGRAAKLADASKVPVTITVAGTPAQRKHVVGLLKLSLKPGTTATVKETAGDSALILTPVPVV